MGHSKPQVNSEVTIYFYMGLSGNNSTECIHDFCTAVVIETFKTTYKCNNVKHALYISAGCCFYTNHRQSFGTL